MLVKRNEVMAAARERVKAAGLRATDARVQVLAELGSAAGLQSHHDIEQALAAARARVDRVTLYRVLDSLVESGLAHRVAGADRVWRFAATPQAAGKASVMVREAHQRHAHFQCSDCGKIVCLRDMPAVGQGRALRMPPGYRTEAVELTVKGRCPGCV